MVVLMLYYNAPKSLEFSGHLAGFRIACDCYNCKERFRADKAPQLAEGTELNTVGGKPDGQKKKGQSQQKVMFAQFVAHLIQRRQFNGMFRTLALLMSDFVKEVYGKDLSQTNLKRN